MKTEEQKPAHQTKKTRLVMADNTATTAAGYPSQPYIYMGLLAIGVITAMTMEWKG